MQAIAKYGRNTDYPQKLQPIVKKDVQKLQPIEKKDFQLVNSYVSPAQFLSLAAKNKTTLTPIDGAHNNYGKITNQVEDQEGSHEIISKAVD